MLNVAAKFQILQFGLCFFTSDKSGVYTAHPFNFYLFPEDRPGSLNDICLDIGGIDFHKDKRFDFNKWIYEGVSYLNGEQESLLLSRISEERHDEDLDVLNLTAEEAKKTAVTLKEIRNWWENGAKNEYVIPNFNPYLRKYMYQEIGKLYPTLNIECKSNGKFSKSLILTMMNAETQKFIKDAKAKKQLSVIQRKSGAHKIFKVLTKLKAPIIGHNVLFDLMFLYSAFQSKLPSSLFEFKAKLHALFPIIYDTMVLLGEEKLRMLFPVSQSLGLESIYKFLSKEKMMLKTEIIMDYRAKYAKTQYYHEAGYDAYITGILLYKLKDIALLNYPITSSRIY